MWTLHSPVFFLDLKQWAAVRRCLEVRRLPAQLWTQSYLRLGNLKHIPTPSPSLPTNKGKIQHENVMFRGCLTIHGNWPSFAREPPIILGVLTVTCPQGWGAARLRNPPDGKTARVRIVARHWGHVVMVFFAAANIPWVPDLVVIPDTVREWEPGWWYK